MRFRMNLSADLHRTESPISPFRRRRFCRLDGSRAIDNPGSGILKLNDLATIWWRHSFARYYIRDVSSLLLLLAAVVFRRVVTTREEGITEITGKVGNALVSTPPNRLAVPKSTIARIRSRDTADSP